MEGGQRLRACGRRVEIDVRYADTHTNGYSDAVGNAGSDMSTVGMHHE